MKAQDSGDQKNLLLAVLLSIGIMLAWEYFYAGPERQKEVERRKKVVAEQSEHKNQAAYVGRLSSSPELDTSLIPGPEALEYGGLPSSSLPIPTFTTRSEALSQSMRLPIETPSIRGSINLSGGRIDDISLKKYRLTVEPSSPNVTLFSPAVSPNVYFAEHGWAPAPTTAVKVPLSDTLWEQQSTGGSLTPGKPVILIWDNNEGLLFKRTISVDEHYMFEITDEVENTTDLEVTLFPYGRIYRGGTPNVEGFFVQHEGMIGFLGEDKLEEITYSASLEQGADRHYKNIIGGWLGFTDKYWAAALVPDQTQPFTAKMWAPIKQAGVQTVAYQTDYLLSPITIAPGSIKSTTSHLFAGAKQVDLINSYESSYDITGRTHKITEFNYLIDWGWFYFITKPLYGGIKWFYDLFGNFGLAILAVTVVVKAIFFWFANKSYESMAKMKKLQPEMERMRERYKDNRLAQQKELMELYKKEKINPLLGCLPMLVQIPVFFALYKVLFISLDMRHAPFFGWIQDLSAKDPTTFLNMFGLLPYTVPDFLVVGVWPLIMGVTMWVQMQLNPQQPDPVQQQIFNWMPILFTFMLAAFPAGLVIYWAWNNVLSLAQQYYIMKRQGVDIPLRANIQRNFNVVGKCLRGLFVVFRK
ncbi:MAG: membrane protein insertase YidC [Hyphomicrobiaceae bacterium]|nr:membrane protein insertase YidC [Hyphomicrobiaceae bacterium]